VQVTRSVVDEPMIEAFARLSAAEYGESAPVAQVNHLRWKYLSCPAGIPEADVLRSDGDVFGRIVYEPRALRSRAGDQLGLNPIDLLIHPRHRTPRAFVELMRGLRDHDGADVVFFVPNDVSAPLYERVLRFPRVGTLRLDGLPLRPERVLGARRSWVVRFPTWAVGACWRVLLRVVNRVIRISWMRVSSTVAADTELDRLVDCLYADEALVGVRDHAFHHWRFGEGPVFTYRVRYAYRRGTLVGYAASRVVDFEDLRTCVVVDCVASSARVSRVLIADVVRDAFRDRVDLVAALSFGDTVLTRGIRRFPLLKVPRRFWPQAMPVHAEWVGTRRDREPPSLSLTLADMDVF
jgi:hypothetical protein